MSKRKKSRNSDYPPPRAATPPPAPSPDAVKRRNLILAIAFVVLLAGGIFGFFAWLKYGGSGYGDPTSGGSNPRFLIETSMGNIAIELFAKDAPITVKNFEDYVEAKHYDGTIFHRVMPDFMIQGGGFGPGLQREKPTRDGIKNEGGNGLKNKRGTLAMARTGDPDSATSQFFINVKDNSFLDRANARDGVGYAVFGKVTDGMDVVERIRNVETHTVGPHEAVPVKDVVIKSISRR